MGNIIEVDNLCFSYADRAILKNLSFSIPEGSFITVAGPNGAGKTTLLNLICGILRPRTGSINIAGKSIDTYITRALARQIAVVRQEFVPAFDFTVNDIVSMARTPYSGLLGLLNQQDIKLIDDALKSTDTADFAERTLSSLSAGERQRVFLARALAQNTPLLLLDEPTTFLDMKHQVGIYDLLKNAQLNSGKTIFAITHDINLAVQYCDYILCFGADSSYQFGRPEQILTPEQIMKNFGVKVFTGRLGNENFFIPLGKFAKISQKKEK